MTKFLNISTDNTLGGNSPSDDVVSSQKAIKTALDAKLDKSSTATVVYGTNSSGNQTTYSIASSATATTVAFRGTGGVLKVGTPTANTHAATKKYVDDIVAAKQDTLVSGTNIKTINNQSILGSGNIDTSGSGGGYHPNILSWEWDDHLRNDAQWLRADTFSWQDGGVYEAAYQHLADDITGKTLQSETISGTTIQFYVADDGHKICPASEESNVVAIYTATGVAWYYIIDTTNQRFKLPRTKYGVVGMRDGVGNYVPESLPDHNHSITTYSALYPWAGNAGSTWQGTKDGVTGNASASNSVYQDGAPVQQRATQMCLYFYVGEFTQTALENTAGLNAELFNDKADVDFNNTQMIDYVIEFQRPTAANNHTWYRKYKSGWVEQGGRATTSSVSFPVTMADTNYQVMMTQTGGSSAYAAEPINHSTTGFTYWQYQSVYSAYWQVSGMAAN